MILVFQILLIFVDADKELSTFFFFIFRALQLADELLHSIPISEHRRGVNSHMAVDN